MSPAVASGPHPAATLDSQAAPPLPGAAPPAPSSSAPGPVSDPESASTPPRPHSLLQAFQSLLYVIVVALFILTFTVQPFRIPSSSMEPTLLVGDFLLVDKQVGLQSSPRVFAPSGVIHRGDLIVFHFPVDPTLHLVKRVVALPGDRLRLRDGRVMLDGRPLPEPYALFRPSGPDPYRDEFPRLSSTDPAVQSRWWVQMRSLVSHGELTVPPDSFFVLGDNRNDSEDSRYWGLVPRANIVGKPFLIYFSLNDRASASGRSIASAIPGREQDQPDGTGPPPASFARWARTLRIIH